MTASCHVDKEISIVSGLQFRRLDVSMLYTEPDAVSFLKSDRLVRQFGRNSRFDLRDAKQAVAVVALETP